MSAVLVLPQIAYVFVLVCIRAFVVYAPVLFPINSCRCAYVAYLMSVVLLCYCLQVHVASRLRQLISSVDISWWANKQCQCCDLEL